MPFASPHVCPAPGCRRLAPRGKRCPKHQEQMDREKKARDSFYYSQPWRDLRAAHLAAFPACAECGAPARVVDHVASRQRAPQRELDPSNLRSLCWAHHSSKTARVDGAWGAGGAGA